MYPIKPTPYKQLSTINVFTIMNIAREFITDKIYTILVLTDVIISDPEITDGSPMIYGRATGIELLVPLFRNGLERRKRLL